MQLRDLSDGVLIPETMSDRPIIELILAAASRSAQETAALADGLADRAWPRGGDRRDPVAAEWLRRWSPARMPVGAAECACTTGRCGWCN